MDEFSKRYPLVVRLTVEAENQQAINLWSELLNVRGPWFADALEQAEMLVGGLAQMLTLRDEERRRAEPPAEEQVDVPVLAAGRLGDGDNPDRIGNPSQERSRSHVWARHPDRLSTCLRCGLPQNPLTLVDGCRDYWTEHDWPDAVPGAVTQCRRCGCDKVPSSAVPERCVARLEEFKAESITWPLAHHWEGPWEPGGRRQCTGCGLYETLEPPVPPACRGHWLEHDVIGTTCRRCNQGKAELTDHQCRPVRSYRISER